MDGVRIKKAASPVLSQNSQDTVNENENGDISANLADHGHGVFHFRPTPNLAPSMLPKIKSELHPAPGQDTLIPVTPAIAGDAVERQRNAQLPPQFSGFPHSPPHGHLPPPHPHARYLPMMYPPFAAVPPPLPPPGVAPPQFGPPQGIPPQFPPPPQQYHMVTPLGLNPPRSFAGNEQDNVATTDSTEDSDSDKQQQSRPRQPPPVAAYQPVMFPTIIPLNASNGMPMIPKPPPMVNGSKMINEDDIFGGNGPQSNFVSFPPSLNHNPNQIMIINQGPFGSHPAYAPYADHKIPFPPPPPPFPLPLPSTPLMPLKRGIKRKRDSDGEDGDNEQNDDDKEERTVVAGGGGGGGEGGSAAMNDIETGNGNGNEPENGSEIANGDGNDNVDQQSGSDRDKQETTSAADDGASNYSDDMEQDVDDGSCDDDDDQKMERNQMSARNLRGRPLRKKRKTSRTRKTRTSPTRRSGPNRMTGTSAGRHVCSYCNKTFVQNCHLSRHIREKHIAAPSRPSFECRICNKSFNQRSNLKVHLRSHALDESVSRPWLCTECYPNRRFTRKSSLKRHWIKKHKTLSAALIAELEESISNQGTIDDRLKDNIIHHPAEYDEAVKAEGRNMENDIKSEPERLRYDNGIYRIGDIEIPPEVFVQDNNHLSGYQVDENALPPLLGN